MLRGRPLAVAGRHALRGSRGWDWYYRATSATEKPADLAHSLLFEPAAGVHRPRAWMTFRIGERDAEHKVTFELASEIAPRTCDNFLNLCRGDGKYAYKGTKVVRLLGKHILLAGDVEGMDGRGGHSSFGERFFDDENFVLKHTGPGVLAMANAGVHTNSSMFYVATKPAPHLDGRNVVFGRVVDGLDAVGTLLQQFTAGNAPLEDIVITDAGVQGAGET